jgi:hypothetical protein
VTIKDDANISKQWMTKKANYDFVIAMAEREEQLF